MKTLFRVIAVLATTAITTVCIASGAGADPASAEGEFLARINQLRADNGAAPLAHDGQMMDVARRWSAEMARRDELSHNPNLKSEVENWRIVGENVGVGSNVELLQRAFEDSPRHRENMVNPKYTHAGIGVVEVDGQVWVTEVFKQARTAAVAAAPTAPAAPRPPAAPRVRVTTPPRPRPVTAPARPAVRAAAPTTGVPTTVAPAPAPPAATELAADPLAGAPASSTGAGGLSAAGLGGVLAAILLGAVVSAVRRPVLALRTTS